MMPALQTRRRASPALMLSPVSRPAALRRSRSCSSSMVTTTVAAVLGCRWSVGRCSRSSQNASPRAWSQSVRRPVLAPTCASVAPIGPRRGAVIVSMTLRSRCPCRVGTVKWPVTVPSSLSCRVSRVFSRAAASSSATSWFSWASTCARPPRSRRARGAPLDAAPSGATRGLLDQGGLDLVALDVGHGFGQLPGGTDDHLGVLRSQGAVGQRPGGGRPLGEPGRKADLPVGCGLVAVRHRRGPLPGARRPHARAVPAFSAAASSFILIAHILDSARASSLSKSACVRAAQRRQLNLAERVEAPQQQASR